MRQKLRSTPRAEQFLAQFDTADSGTVALLVDSLILVSADEFRATLTTILASMVNESDRPLALFAAREAETVPYFSLEDKSLRPSAVAAGAKVGSEGPLANLLRDFSHLHGPSAALDHPHIDSMKAVKVRKLVVVDDIIGSGQRIRSFVRWLSAHPTIRSWLSYGVVQFVAVAYAATAQGQQLLESKKYISDVVSGRLAEKGNSSWTKGERDEIVSLCNRYAKHTSRSFWPLGFAGAMTTLLFQHKVPNTTPAIIWAGSKGWQPLVEKRPEFSFKEWPQNIGTEDTLRRVLTALNQRTLSQLQWMKFVSPNAHLRFALLAILAKRRLPQDILSAITNISKADCDQLLRECRGFGWLSSENRITEQGKLELQNARDFRLIPMNEVTLTDKIYVPQCFRGASD